MFYEWNNRLNIIELLKHLLKNQKILEPETSTFFDPNPDPRTCQTPIRAIANLEFFLFKHIDQ